MPQETRSTVIENLRNAGISPSEPRIAVFSYLVENKTHPTVETIFRALQDTHPTLSRTTVYNTLRLLAAQRLVSTLNIEDGELRYDADTHFHAHFKCRKCGMIMDVFDTRKPEFPAGCGARLEDIQTNFYGLCKNCLPN